MPPAACRPSAIPSKKYTTMTAIIIASAALVTAIIAVVISLKRQKVTERVVEKETVKVVHAPVEHPFVYEEETGFYRLDGSLYATGALAALDKQNK